MRAHAHVPHRRRVQHGTTSWRRHHTGRDDRGSGLQAPPYASTLRARRGCPAGNPCRRRLRGRPLRCHCRVRHLPYCHIQLRIQSRSTWSAENPGSAGGGDSACISRGQPPPQVVVLLVVGGLQPPPLHRRAARPAMAAEAEPTAANAWLGCNAAARGSDWAAASAPVVPGAVGSRSGRPAASVVAPAASPLCGQAWAWRPTVAVAAAAAAVTGCPSTPAVIAGDAAAAGRCRSASDAPPVSAAATAGGGPKTVVEGACRPQPATAGPAATGSSQPGPCMSVGGGGRWGTRSHCCKCGVAARQNCGDKSGES